MPDLSSFLKAKTLEKKQIMQITKKHFMINKNH